MGTHITTCSVEGCGGPCDGSLSFPVVVVAAGERLRVVAHIPACATCRRTILEASACGRVRLETTVREASR